MPMVTRSAGVQEEPPDVRDAEDVAPFLTSTQKWTPAGFNLVKRLMIDVAELDKAGRHAEAQRLIDEVREELL